jgi:hypothetical protein
MEALLLQLLLRVMAGTGSYLLLLLLLLCPASFGCCQQQPLHFQPAAADPAVHSYSSSAAGSAALQALHNPTELLRHCSSCCPAMQHTQLPQTRQAKLS